MSKKIFDAYRPEILKTAHIVDFLPRIELRRTADMRALWKWIDYFKAHKVPFEVREHPVTIGAVQLWKVQKVAYRG